MSAAAAAAATVTAPTSRSIHVAPENNTSWAASVLLSLYAWPDSSTLDMFSASAVAQRCVKPLERDMLRVRRSPGYQNDANFQHQYAQMHARMEAMKRWYEWCIMPIVNASARCGVRPDMDAPSTIDSNGILHACESLLHMDDYRTFFEMNSNNNNNNNNNTTISDMQSMCQNKTPFEFVDMLMYLFQTPRMLEWVEMPLVPIRDFPFGADCHLPDSFYWWQTLAGPMALMTLPPRMASGVSDYVLHVPIKTNQHNDVQTMIQDAVCSVQGPITEPTLTMIAENNMGNKTASYNHLGPLLGCGCVLDVTVLPGTASNDDGGIEDSTSMCGGEDQCSIERAAAMAGRGAKVCNHYVLRHLRRFPQVLFVCFDRAAHDIYNNNASSSLSSSSSSSTTTLFMDEQSRSSRTPSVIDIPRDHCFTLTMKSVSCEKESKVNYTVKAYILGEQSQHHDDEQQQQVEYHTTYSCIFRPHLTSTSWVLSDPRQTSSSWVDMDLGASYVGPRLIGMLCCRTS